jgi:hypothetical protein
MFSTNANNSYEKNYLRHYGNNQNSADQNMDIKDIIASEFSDLKKFIVDSSPSSSSSLPFNSKDIYFLKDKLNSLDSKINTVWNDTKWALGLFSVIFLGILGFLGWFISKP